MPGFLMHVNAALQCPHRAPALVGFTQKDVLVLGQPVATVASPIAVTGCLFQVPVPGGTKPQPCVRVQWAMPAKCVLIMGQPALLQPPPPTGAGPGTCLSVEQIPQGPPAVTYVQNFVFGT